nr:hypothetical protein [Tanacetum cinerariifolium]
MLLTRHGYPYSAVTQLGGITDWYQEPSIPSEHPYEEAAQQLLEQAPRSPEYVPDPIELEDHVPAYIPEHPEDLLLTEDEAPIEAYIPEVASAPTPTLPPSFLPRRIPPPHTRAAMAQMIAAVPSTYHSLLPSGTPPLLPIPLPVPSTSRKAEILWADMSPQKRLLLTAPRLGYEVGESSVAVARQPGPTMACSVDCSFVDTMETRFRDTERRMMTALEMVNMRVSYQVDVCSRERSEFYSRHHDAQKDHAAARAEIEVLRRERLAYEQEMLETQARRHEWQRQTADDFAVQHIMRTHALEAEARIDTLEDTDPVYFQIIYEMDVLCYVDLVLVLYFTKMEPKRTTRSTQVPPVTPAPTSTTTTVTEAQLYALIDQGVAAVMVEAEASRGTEGVVVLTQWFEKMESVFNISNCTTACQVKYAACTLQGVALTWWNSHVKTVTLEVAQALPWKTLKKMMTDKYCPRGEIKKLETEMWELKTKGTDVIGEGSQAKTMQEAIEFATELMDKRIRDVAENKRKFEGISGNNQNQPQQNKRQNTGQAYTVGNSDRNIYTGFKPLCSKCNYHHEGPFPPRCNNCKRVGHLTRNDNAQAKVYVVGNEGANPDNVVAGTFLLKNRYAYILFDTGADRIFVSTTFSSQIDIAPIALDHHYNVEIADGRIIGLTTIMRDCTLNFLNHPFNIDLLPIELGSFDVIIGMDWLSRYNAVIACAEKLVRIPSGNEIFTIHGEGRNERNESPLNII